MFVKVIGSEHVVRNQIAEKNVFSRQTNGPFYEALVEDTFTLEEKMQMNKSRNQNYPRSRK